MNHNKICILGAGGWGTALAIMLTDKGLNPVLWTFDSNLNNDINENHQNKTYLPGINLPEGLTSTMDISIVESADLLVNAIPTQYIAPTFDKYRIDLANKKLVNCSKGIETESLSRISELMCNRYNLNINNYSVITGPSHAEEVARKMPTTVVAASSNPDYAISIRDIFSTERFRVYTSYDYIGCELGGSLKNIIAIAAGIIDGLGFGDNSKAALLTRGLAEMKRLGNILGADPMTFSGLSGLGDLIVTCNSKHSRNRLVGEQIGKGKQIKQILEEMKMVAEGVWTTKSAYLLSKKHNVEMPITEQMYKILFEGQQPLNAIDELLKRESKDEFWW
jgi:glycerol-3-phosphate dehydrogenase (NAD(P)+)